MLLAVDAGNTNVVFALVDGGEIRRAGASPPTRAAPPTNMRSGCTSCSRSRAIERDVDARDHRHGGAARAAQSRGAGAANISASTPLIAGAGRGRLADFQLDVDEPQNVGADRALNAIAAHAQA